MPRPPAFRTAAITRGMPGDRHHHARPHAPSPVRRRPDRSHLPALYADFDLRTVDGVHVAVPKGVACFTGRSLGEIARQISDRENPHEDMAPDSHKAAAPCPGI